MSFLPPFRISTWLRAASLAAAIAATTATAPYSSTAPAIVRTMARGIVRRGSLTSSASVAMRAYPV